MGLFSFGKKDSSASDEAVTCQKCKKQKKKSEGTYMLEGTTFCCKSCCGDPAKGEHKQEDSKTCEFC